MAKNRGKNRNKSPKNKFHPNPSKIPKYPRNLETSKLPKDQVQGTNHLTVHWSFAIFDPMVWHERNHQEETFRDIAKRLRDSERRTWSEIEADKKRDHSVPKTKLIPQARKRLIEIKQDDIDDLWRFRFTGKLRIWGIRDGRLFKVLWLDPQHKICPSEKKHT